MKKAGGKAFRMVRSGVALFVAATMGLSAFIISPPARAVVKTKSVSAVTLAVPQNVHEENGFIVWDEVENAYGYTIQAVRGKKTWEYKWYENRIEWARFIYEQCSLDERDFGDYIFRVCAFDETGTLAGFSDPVTISYQATLSMPVNVRVPDGSQDSLRLTWDKVEGAARYNIQIFRNNESHSRYTTTYTTYNSLNYGMTEGEYLVTVQAMDQDYHVSGWTEEVLVKVDARRCLAKPQNVRFDESGNNIIWDEVEGADYYYVDTGFGSNVRCSQPVLTDWKRYISPWAGLYNGMQTVYLYACSNSDISSSSWSQAFRFEYVPSRDESIIVPQIEVKGNYVTWDEAENAFRYLCRIVIDGKTYQSSSYEKSRMRQYSIAGYPEGDCGIELCVIDEEGNYNSKIYPLTLDTAHDESVWVPKLFHKFEKVLWDYDRLRHPNTNRFWVRTRRQKDGAVVKLTYTYEGFYNELMDLKNGDYMLDVCVREYAILGKWSETMDIEKHGEGLYEKENETTTKVETPPEAADIPEEDRITSITINPAFNMKHKEDNDVELDLSKIKIKAKEIYDEEGLKRAEEALGETLNGNKQYNLLDLTLLYDGKDFSHGYDGLVKVIIPLPKGHRDKTYSCYRLTEKDGKVTKEIIPGEQTEDSYIIYLEHFSEYALVAAGPEEPHTHVYSADWKSDAAGHWKECACEDKTEQSAHTQDAGTVTKEATQTEAGIKTYKCSICGYVIKTEVIAKLPAEEEPHTHVYSADWKSDAAGHWKECACEDKTEQSAHTQDAGTVTKEATQTEAGIKTYKCSVCGYVIKTEVIAKLPVKKEPANEIIAPVAKVPAVIVSKAQKKKNKMIINKRASFKVTGNSLMVEWNKLPGAKGYDIYAALCDTDFKGVTCNVKKNKTSAVIRVINNRKINGKKTYKVKVKAYRLLPDGKKQYIGTSAVMHVAGSQNKARTNAKKIILEKKAYTLREKRSARIRAAIIKADKKKKLLSKEHGAKLSYVSSDETIATVTATGRIKAKKRGKCTIYVRALNGVSKKIKVTIFQ